MFRLTRQSLSDASVTQHVDKWVGEWVCVQAYTAVSF